MFVKGMNFTIGADPEIFAGKDGKFVSAHNLIPGCKSNPHKVNKGAVQVDGMALEFNIDPAENLEQFMGNLKEVQNTLKGMIGDYEFIQDTAVHFDESFIKNIPIENLALGCEADYNGWTMRENPTPNEQNLMRTVGGHVHLGGFYTDDPFDPGHFESCGRLARILDQTLGIYSVLWDNDAQRRSMYGRAGSFRPKPYGMEYRPLSNKWIFDNKLVSFVYQSVERALNLAFEPDFEPLPEVQGIINNSVSDADFFKNNRFAKMVTG